MSRTLLEPAGAAPGPPPIRRRWVHGPGTAFTRASLESRLLGPGISLRLYGWLIPVLTAVIGGVLRFVRLGEPHSLVFDETYYVKDAYSLLVSGYEREWPEHANKAFNAGDPSVILSTPEYVVHPPVGKWMISFGMWLFGSDNSFGWRFSAALVGTISILLIALIAQKLFGSVVLGGLAGLLTAVDGNHLVMSRTSLLDIFLMFWVVCAFGALLLDRDDGRRRLARRLAAGTGQGYGPAGTDGGSARAPAAYRTWSSDASRLRAALSYGPWLGFRPWRLAAGICLGLVTGTKWSGLFFIIVFGLMTVLWDMHARRVAGIQRWVAAGVIKDGLFAFVCVVPVAAATYLATWTGWFLSGNAYNRDWAKTHPSSTWGWLPDALRSLADYQLSAYNFHRSLTSDHPYKASAWTWLVMGRPTSFYYESPGNGQSGCQVHDCSAAISSVGNPLIWWAAAAALLVLLWYWIGARDWRAGAILAGIAAGYLPWFAFPDRTTFFFYSIAFEPFLILALVYCLGLVLGRRTDPPWRRQRGMVLVGLFVAAVLLATAFFYPIWTAEVIPYDDWRLRMWMPSWI